MKYVDFLKSNGFIRCIGNSVSAGCISAAMTSSTINPAACMLPANIANLITSVREIMLKSDDSFDPESYKEAESDSSVQWYNVIAAVFSLAALIMLIVTLVRRGIERRAEADSEDEYDTLEDEVFAETEAGE